MKKIIYLLSLLLCIAGCKKQQVEERLAVTRVSFINKTQLMSNPILKYDNKVYSLVEKISSLFGDNKVEICDGVSGEVIIDTVLNINGPREYYIYQPDATVKPTIITELPPLPEAPDNPLDNIEPAPEGYMKIKIKHDLFREVGLEKIDVQVLSAINSFSTYELLTTIPNVTTTFSKDFVLIKRPVVNGTLVQQYKFRFINSVTKEPVKSGTGAVYTTFQVTLNRQTYNAFLLSFASYDISPDNMGVENNGLFYEIDPDLLDQK